MYICTHTHADGDADTSSGLTHCLLSFPSTHTLHFSPLCEICQVTVTFSQRLPWYHLNIHCVFATTIMSIQCMIYSYSSQLAWHCTKSTKVLVKHPYSTTFRTVHKVPIYHLKNILKYQSVTLDKSVC